jgi:hypothetical protein
MTESRSSLGEIATEAGLERASFLHDAAEQLHRFLNANRDRIREVGGMVLIDEDPDYLSIAPDLTFRSRSRYQDEKTGEWVSDTEVIESPSELIELYNPADVYAAFAEAARVEAGLGEEPTGAQDLLEVAGVSPDAGVSEGDPYAGAAEDWAASQATAEAPAQAPEDPTEAARRLYDLALTFQERSQQSEARIIEQFEVTSRELAGVVGDQMILDDDDERLWFKGSGSFEAEVLPEREGTDEATGEWVSLQSPEEMVQFYDPTDLFGDLAETLAEQYPEVAPGAEEDGNIEPA